MADPAQERNRAMIDATLSALPPQSLRTGAYRSVMKRMKIRFVGKKDDIGFARACVAFQAVSKEQQAGRIIMPAGYTHESTRAWCFVLYHDGIGLQPMEVLPDQVAALAKLAGVAA